MSLDYITDCILRTIPYIVLPYLNFALNDFAGKSNFACRKYELKKKYFSKTVNRANVNVHTDKRRTEARC